MFNYNIVLMYNAEGTIKSLKIKVLNVFDCKFNYKQLNEKE